MSRVVNFNAGPSALPLEALQAAQAELLDFEGSGMSIMEHSHRGAVFERVHEETLSLLRELMAIPSDYHVLLLQGGASLQFAMVPLNFMKPTTSADYLVTGGWSEKALEEAQRIGDARAAVNVKAGTRFSRIPDAAEIQFDAGASYVHMTSNNTLFGTQWHALPRCERPLVVDMSSDILGRPIDVSKCAMIYAGAQKNIGPSGVTVAILNPDFAKEATRTAPAILRYETHIKANSLYNTPPTFGIYLMRNVLRVLKSIGMEQVYDSNRKKAARLYAALDASNGFFSCPVETTSRSHMNVVFNLRDGDTEKRFVKGALERGMVGLAGHRVTGGIRVSLYNAVSQGDVEKLIAFMGEFQAAEG